MACEFGHAEVTAAAGVDPIELSTGDDLVETIMRFSELRKRRNQLTAGAVSSKSRGEFGDVSVA